MREKEPEREGEIDRQIVREIVKEEKRGRKGFIFVRLSVPATC